MIYIVFLVFTFLVLSIVFYQGQYFLIFSPTYYRKEKLGADCEMLSIMSDDGIELEGVVYEPWNATQTLLVFTGRKHDSVGLIEKLSLAYPKVCIVTFNYRSYGKSQGRANEKNLLKDSLKIGQMVQKHYGDFAVLGFSLGAHVATYLASQQKVKALFLIGAFDSFPALLKSKIGIDVSKIVRYELNTEKYMKEVALPTYIFASKDDEVVDAQNVRVLKDSVKFLAHFEETSGVRHDKLMFDERIVKQINKVFDDKKIV